MLLGHTIDSLGFAPAVAARGGLGFASDVDRAVAGTDGPVARRGAYGDKLRRRARVPRQGVHAADAAAGDLRARRRPAAAGAPARAVELATSTGPRAPSTSGSRRPPAGDVDITKAEFLLSIGRGIEDKDNIPRFEELAERLGATLSVSARWSTPAGCRARARSASRARPSSRGCTSRWGSPARSSTSAGMRAAETIIAVNTDPEAPIFGVAHYGAVADMFEVADELEQALE